MRSRPCPELRSGRLWRLCRSPSRTLFARRSANGLAVAARARSRLGPRQTLPAASHRLTGVVTKLSPRSVADTVARLTELVAAKGMKLFAVIDQSAEARQAGLELRETTLVIFG